MCKGFLLKWILPEDKKQLRDWLYYLELGNIVLSIAFLYFFIHALLASEQFLKDAFISTAALASLSVSTVLQYLLAIEFNTRRK